MDRGTEPTGLGCSLLPLASLPSTPKNQAAPTLRYVPPPADTHPRPWLNAGTPGEQTRLSASPASHSAGLVCPKRLPLNLPLSAPPGTTSVARAGCLLCCALFIYLFWAPYFFCKMPPGASCARLWGERPPHRHPPCSLWHSAPCCQRVIYLFFFPKMNRFWVASEFC